MLGCMMLLVTVAGSPAPNAMPHFVQRDGMEFGWRVRGPRLQIVARAPTQGWLVVGFNSKPGLDGARLVFMRVRAGVAECEVHRTDFSYPPPYHQPRTRIGGTNYARVSAGHESSQGTQVSCEIPLVSGEVQDVRLRLDQSTEVILAYSRSDDFEHHSAMRTAVSVRLGGDK